MPDQNQPLIGQNEPGTLAPSYPTPASDIQFTGITEGNITDYLQGVYGQPPPGGTNPDYFLVNETPINWQYFKRIYAKDRLVEDTYNASISYLAESKDHPIFTRDYIVRRAVYQPRNRLSSLTGIVNATVTAGGSGYDQSKVTVTLSGGTGSGGAVTAVVSAGVIVHLVITAEGNYTVAPTVTINGNGAGSGATGTVEVQPATALLTKEDYIRTPDNPMDGLYVLVRRVYTTLPGPVLSGTQLDKKSNVVVDYQKQFVASGTVLSGVVGAVVLSLTIVDGGTGYTGNGTLVFSGGGGSGAAGTFTFSAASPSGKIGSVTLTNPGAGFTFLPTATISGGGGSGATVSVVITGKPIATLTLLSSDNTFTDVPPVVITDTAGTGSGATGLAKLAATTVASIAVDSGGTGYTAPTVTISAPDDAGGTQATATATVSGGAVTSISMTDNGTGYRRVPTVTITEVGGSGAAATASLTATTVESVTLTATGNGYQNPLVSCTIGGSNASVSAAIQPTSIASLTLTAAGSGYSSPIVTISGGGGGGATATAALATGTVTGVTLTNPGAGYTSAPTITTSGGGGSGAVIVAVLASLTWVEVDPQTSCIDLVMRTSPRLNSLRTIIGLPISYRVQRRGFHFLTFITVSADDRIAVGSLEEAIEGGNGAAQAYMDIYYLTDSGFKAFVATANRGFSVSGGAVSGTQYFAWSDAGGPHVYTARVTPITNGTSAGIVDISAEQQQYGIWEVRVTYLNQSF